MKKLIIAHRGASGYVKENTLEAFWKAIELGADMVEFDVRKTRDAILVIHHDPKIEGKNISELTYTEILESFERKGFHVPTFEETLIGLKGKIKLDVELKEEGYEAEVMDMILKYFRPDEFIVTSFVGRALLKIKTEYPRTKTGLLLGQGRPKNFLKKRLEEAFSYFAARKFKVDYLLPHLRLAKLPFYIKMSARSGFPNIVWGVDKKILAETFLEDTNVFGIITDYPDIMKSAYLDRTERNLE